MHEKLQRTFTARVCYRKRRFWDSQRKSLSTLTCEVSIGPRLGKNSPYAISNLVQLVVVFHIGKVRPQRSITSSRSQSKLMATSKSVSSCWTPGQLPFQCAKLPRVKRQIDTWAIDTRAPSKVEIGTIPHRSRLKKNIWKVPPPWDKQN